jgi:hypothetical protein
MRHPQDFLRGIPDDSSTPWSRPRSYAYIETDVLINRFWEYTGDWTSLSAEAWYNTISGEATFGQINLRTDSLIPVGLFSGPISPGDVVTLSAVITGEVLYGGSIFGQLKYYDTNMNVLSTDYVFTFDEYDATGSWLSSGSVTVPTSTAFIQIIYKANGLSAASVSLSAPSLTIGGTAGVESTSAWNGDIPVSPPVGPSPDGDAAYTGYDLGE